MKLSLRVSGTLLSIARLTGFGVGLAFLPLPALADDPTAQRYCDSRYKLVRSGADGRTQGRQETPQGAFKLANPSTSLGRPIPQPGAQGPGPLTGVGSGASPILDRDRFPEADPGKWRLVYEAPVSTFGADVDTASYTVVRRMLGQGRLPRPDAVRPEELINYFDYGYAPPDSIEEGFRPTAMMYPAPWDRDRYVLQIGIRAFDIPLAERPPANLVFLLDVSGSMNAPDRLPLAKRAICYLVHQLEEQDRIAIVVYAGAAGVALPPTSGANRETVLSRLDDLSAGGSTAGEEGIELAYALAEQNFRDGAANRVLLATDGDFNVGVADDRALAGLVARKRDTGIFLTVLGFGLGNYNDQMMQALAQSGNGVAAYIDSEEEARRVLIDGLTASLVTVASDVKFQVEFNPALVREYRLIGYETRELARTDFNNDRVDSGDVGSGHSVTALYELALAGAADPSADPLRYDDGRQDGAPDTPLTSDELAYLKIRFKPPGSTKSRLIGLPITRQEITESIDAAPGAARVASALAWFAMSLRDDPIEKADDWQGILALASEGRVAEKDDARYRDFLTMLDRAAELD